MGIKVGITSIQRNRSKWLTEWICFHYLVGFRKFYIYLHDCKDNSKIILQKLKKEIDIDTIEVDKNLNNPQLPSYEEAYAKHSNEIDWMAFIDGDEFLFPTKHKNIGQPLLQYADLKLSAIGVYWACFGSSNFEAEPEGLIIENYKYKAALNNENNRHIKSIIKGGFKDIIPRSPHLFQTPNGTFDENLRPITKGWTDYDPTYHQFRINHYVTQSREFFDTFKIRVSPPDGAQKRDESYWTEHNKNEVFDDSMNRFIKPLKYLISNL